MKDCFVALLLATIVFFPSAAAKADSPIPPLPRTYVSDFAHLLNPNQKASLETQLAQIEKAGSNQILVVTIPDLEEEPIEDYSMRLAEKWKPGQNERNNGVILLIAPKDRKMRIEVGYGLEGALTDATSKNIIETQIAPAFRRGDFYAGIQNGVQAIAQAIAGEYQPMPVQGGSHEGGFSLLLIVFFILFFIILIRSMGGGRPGYGIRRGTWGAGPGGWSSGGWGGSSGGGGWSSGGGFSSGGGSFGGGGASGSW